MKRPAVMLIGSNRAEATLASAALYCAGARIVTSRPDLALLVEVKSSTEMPRRLHVPLVAIVRPGEKRKALKAGVDAAYSRPAQWKAYSRLVERVLAHWAPTRKGARRRRARTS
jgi:hypothetical protein